MGPPRRKLQATVEDTLTPPESIPASQCLAQIVGAKGKNLYQVRTAAPQVLLVELEAKFRSTIWLKRGGYVLIDTSTLADRDNKIDGEIVNVVRDEKAWRKASFWPQAFARKSASLDSDEDESTVGKMPPSDDEDEER
jgi:probable RNA-binding protein EIF1AD